MDHRELQDIAADVLLKGRKDAYVSQTVAQMYENAIAVLDVVEPLIRADEREKWRYAKERSARLADLRAKVEGLTTRGIGARVIDGELETYGLVERAEVLDLLDGEE